MATFMSMGLAVVHFNDRLGQSFRGAALDALRDGKAAVRFLRANAEALKVDPTRTAGGDMAAMLGAAEVQVTIFPIDM